jgi:hypothetical protein
MKKFFDNLGMERRPSLVGLNLPRGRVFLEEGFWDGGVAR